MERTIDLKVSQDKQRCDIYQEAFLNNEMTPGGCYVTKISVYEDFGEIHMLFKLKKAGQNRIINSRRSSITN